MQMLWRSRYILLVSLVLIFSAGISAFGAEEEVVATGKGFRVTRDDLRELYQYFNAKGFTSTDEQYAEAAVKMRLFSIEARTLGLVEKEGAMSVERMDWESQKYLSMVFNNYEVSDLAVESYYWSNPKVFRNKNFNPDKPDENEPEFIPLDENVKKNIITKIRKANTAKIIHETYESLKKEYDVRFCNRGECAK